MQPIFDYTSPVWYYKLTGQWKGEIQKLQDTGLYRILGPFRSTSVKAMQHNAGILLINILTEEIRN